MNGNFDSALTLLYVKDEPSDQDIKKAKLIADEINENNTVYNAELRDDGFRITLCLKIYAPLSVVVKNSIEYCVSRKRALFPSKTKRGCSFNNFTVALKYYNHIERYHRQALIDCALLEGYLYENLKIKRNLLKKRCKILLDEHGFCEQPK